MTVGKSLLDRRLEILGAWSGIAWVVICGGGFGGSGLVPVFSPATKPEVLSAFIVGHRYQILIGMMLVLFGGYTFLMTWSLTFAYQVRKYASTSQLAFYLMVIVGVNGGVIGMLCGTIGSAMAYRAGSVDPATIQVMYDLIWFLFLIPWPPFLLWQLVAGFAILSKSNDERYFPRWTGYFCLWAGALEVFSALSVFFYRGPFSYNGAVTFWLPGASFFIWVLVLSIVQIRSWSRSNEMASKAPDTLDITPAQQVPENHDVVAAGTRA
jgi:hypothetical protein